MLMCVSRPRRRLSLRTKWPFSTCSASPSSTARSSTAPTPRRTSCAGCRTTRRWSWR
jgi:hypothetical protein